LAALTPLVGVTAAELDERGDELLAEHAGLLRELGATFSAHGMAALFERLAARTRLTERILRHEGGERTLTDLRHVAQLLNREARTRRPGLIALARSLPPGMAEHEPVTYAVRSRVLAGGSAAIHTVTILAAKGLVYRVVYLPFGWDGSKPRD